MEFTKDICFDNDTLIENQKCKLTYSGKLFKNNSDDVTIVFGFGDNWDNTTEQLMEKTENGFCAEIELLNFDKLNFCFRNSGYEWDNNNNCNYIVSILPPTLPTTFEEKTSLLDEILTESKTEVSKVEEFSIDALLDEILNPVINYHTEFSEYDTFESIVTKEKEETVIIGIEELFESAAPVSVEEASMENALVSVDVEDKFIVSPRKLSAFYMIRKKIKLALYKALVSIPKLLSGEYEDSKNK